MTANEAFNYMMNAYPMLYQAPTLQEARNKYFDHMFNTIGNGFSSFEDLKQTFTWTPVVAVLTKSFPDKYIGAHPLYTGYTALREGAGPSSHRVSPESALRGLYTEEEKMLHPNVVRWVQSNRTQEPFTPYPNFERKYSLLHRVDLHGLDDSWLETGIEYYNQAKQFFDGPRAESYQGAWPSSPVKQETLIKDYTCGFESSIRGIENQQEQWAAISRAYGHPYQGNIIEFIQSRAAKEHDRIQTFIASTIGMLENELASRRVLSAGPSGP